MAQYRVLDTELGAIADAIRTKGNTSAQLEFPNDFVSAIGNITTGTQTGGGTSITQADNGKVVVNGELTSQTSRTITANGTYDTTTNNEVVVNVSGGDREPVSLSDLVEWINENNLFSINWSLVPYYTSATNPTGYVLSYSSQDGISVPAWAVFNETTRSVTTETTGQVRWSSAQAMPQWVQIELPTAQKINSFYIATCYFTKGNMCKSFKVQGSNDGSAFTDLYTGSFENAAINKYIALSDESSAYKYYRIVVTDSYYSGYCGLASFFPTYIDTSGI